jgi:hypothetical protein
MRGTLGGGGAGNRQNIEANESLRATAGGEGLEWKGRVV